MAKAIAKAGADEMRHDGTAVDNACLVAASNAVVALYLKRRERMHRDAL